MFTIFEFTIWVNSLIIKMKIDNLIINNLAKYQVISKSIVG